MQSGTRSGATIAITKALALVIVLGAIAIVATSGDSVAVRAILALLAGDIAVRLWLA